MGLLSRFLDLSKPGFDGVMDWLLAFRKELGVPHSLAELGVKDTGRGASLSEIGYAMLTRPKSFHLRQI